MEKRQAQTIVKETFQNSFDKERFVRFAKELLNHIEPAPFIYRGNIVPDAYEQHISSLERVGKYTDGEHEIDILIVKLKKMVAIERARTMQRNFIAWYLNGSRGDKMKDAALVAFVSPDEQDWRFSLVKMEYRLEQGKNKKIKVNEEFTPAKRWSFLVGINENSHTAQSRLAPIVEDDEHNPTLQQLEDAFNIEKVTKEFFEKYRDLFLRVSETLQNITDKDNHLKKDFADKNVNIADFSKKLLGQIVFLYFLQKKGWFGVPMSKAWGDGDKKFMRSIFQKSQADNKNYFNDYLEPLFYEALAKERDEDYYSRFECKIPFLNGGLFDPISNYDWVNTVINLPDDLFSNTRKTKQGDVGDGVLDIFDRYNFTVKEDEPLEKEVAVDPEMLGKVFENLLEVKDRKSKGTYYTPREIVHYMCEQSLINYLATELLGKVGKEDIEQFVVHGETVGENEARVESEGKETETYFYKLPESVREYAQEIDGALATIKVCDPAIGSGAFPVGMMNEIVKARGVLSAYLKDSGRSAYNFKRDCIQNSLYGIDIDPGAVEIAKLRLWLSLVVDEDDIKQIKPLPNLDYKIMQGNSLLEEFEGIKLFDEKLLATPVIDARIFIKENQQIISLQGKLLEYYKVHPEWLKKKHATKPTEVVELERDLRTLLQKTKHIEPSNSEQRALFTGVAESKQIRDEMTHLHKRFFEETNKVKKDQLRKQIDALEWQLIEATLREEKKISALEKLEQFKHAHIKPFFLWKLHFAEVFEEKGGFDVVIANPPYLKERDSKQIFNEVYNSSFGKKWHQGKMDYWYYFLHKAIDVVRDKGVISYITSRYWINSSGASRLIERVRRELSFVGFVDIGRLKVFDEVAGLHMVAIYKKDKSVSTFIYKRLVNIISDISENLPTENLQIKVLNNNSLFSDNDEILVEEGFRSFKGSIKLGEICEISQGVVEAPDVVSRKSAELGLVTGISQGMGVFVLSNQELNSLKLNQLELKTIKKYLDPKDVFRYGIKTRHKRFLIYSDKEVKEQIKGGKMLPHIQKHLDKFALYITSSNKPYGLHRPREKKYFENPKIIFKNMFVRPEFAYDKNAYYFGFSFSSIIQKDVKYNLKYILGILNSRFASLWYSKFGKERGAGFDIGVEKLRQFPIVQISSSDQKPFVNLVDKIIQITINDNYATNDKEQKIVRGIEEQIDKMVYKLYGLTSEEVKIVKDNVG